MAAKQSLSPCQHLYCRIFFIISCPDNSWLVCWLCWMYRLCSTAQVPGTTALPRSCYQFHVHLLLHRPAHCADREVCAVGIWEVPLPSTHNLHCSPSHCDHLLHHFVCPGGILVHSLIRGVWVDPQCQPGAVWAQLRRGVCFLLLLHDFKSAEQERGREAFDVEGALIWGCRGQSERTKVERMNWQQHLRSKWLDQYYFSTDSTGPASLILVDYTQGHVYQFGKLNDTNDGCFLYCAFSELLILFPRQLKSNWGPIYQWSS